MPNGKKSCFADTMLLVYAMDPDESEKRQRAKDLLKQIIRRHTLVLSPQSLNEFYRVMTERRGGLVPRDDARRLVWSWSDFCTGPYDFEVTQRAWKIQDRHGFGWWDCLLLASASIAGCEVFLSEDMQHERSVEGLTILDPFQLQPINHLFG